MEGDFDESSSRWKLLKQKIEVKPNKLLQKMKGNNIWGMLMKKTIYEAQETSRILNGIQEFKNEDLKKH